MEKKNMASPTESTKTTGRCLEVKMKIKEGSSKNSNSFSYNDRISMKQKVQKCR